MSNEADTCRRYVVPRLCAAGWDDEPHRINEQVTFTDGRILVTGRRASPDNSALRNKLLEAVRRLQALLYAA